MSDETARVVELHTPKAPTDHELLLAMMTETRKRIAYLELLQRILGAYAYLWATLLFVASAWAYALIVPTIPRIVCAVLFTGLTHLPAWWRQRKDAT